RARGLINRFQRENNTLAPSAYPQVAALTGPMRSTAVERDDPDGLNLWAGQAHALARDLPAGELVTRWGADAREALREAAGRWR
ncbi:MAG: nitronate monooxygenase, partial [Solirubrobacterales bacterium]|nr:nitronate monooxygenase [Solirubrobacterales bacterium]